MIKPIDKIILYSLLAILLSVLLGIMLSIGIAPITNVIGGIFLVAYIVFVLLHIALLAPLAYIIANVYYRLNNIQLICRIKEKSDIVYFSIFLLASSIVLFIIYLVFPIISAMLFNGSINLDAAISLLNKIL